MISFWSRQRHSGHAILFDYNEVKTSLFLSVVKLLEYVIKFVVKQHSQSLQSIHFSHSQMIAIERGLD